jgi:hypothetical protein
MVGWSVFVFAAGCLCMVGGTYGAVFGLIEDYNGYSGAASGSYAVDSDSS